jgi:hypothetical protein
VRLIVRDLKRVGPKKHDVRGGGKSVLALFLFTLSQRPRRPGAPLLSRCARSSTRRSGCASPDGCAAL